MVNGMHHRHPAVTANAAVTVDHISGGRFSLGLGAGWFQLESQAYGIPLGTMRERFDRLDEGVEVIVSLLSKPQTTFAGRYYQLTDARCEPKPVQAKLPIVIGGRGRSGRCEPSPAGPTTGTWSAPARSRSGAGPTPYCSSTAPPSGATPQRSCGRCT